MRNKFKGLRRWMWMMSLSFIICHLSFSPAGAQSRLVRYDCMAPGTTSVAEGVNAVSAAPRRLPALKTEWDSTRVYPVAVVLVSFKDKDFSSEDPVDRYNRIFNEEGYNEGRGPGCVADYFKAQSEGWFKPHFDIYGPIKVTKKCTAYGDYGGNAFKEATQILIDSLDVDFSPYDWNGDKRAEHIVFIYAGYGGNEEETQNKGYIWPNTSNFTNVQSGSIKMSYYSASAELWSNDKLCGIGTICHEYTHTLGLPDLYPTSSGSSEYSVVDEWDLMDGGNFINNGWCPCNYSAYEKNVLGWLELEELVDPVDIDELKPVNEGGTAFVVHHTDKEFLVIENRQWTGWDLRIPGRGLLIAHVDDMLGAGNSVNNRPNHHRYDYFHADNLSYTEWDDIVNEQGLSRVGGHSPYLSGTAYPCLNDSVENIELTDESVPAAQMFNENEEGSTLLGKAITNITMTEDGLVSFEFMKSTLTVDVPWTIEGMQTRVYDLNGHLVESPRAGRLYLLRRSDGTMTKRIF